MTQLVGVGGLERRESTFDAHASANYARLREACNFVCFVYACNASFTEDCSRPGFANGSLPSHPSSRNSCAQAQDVSYAGEVQGNTGWHPGNCRTAWPPLRLSSPK